ncbi:MAG: 3-isopropylmalate dehydratase small subunit [Acidobacteria bacterium]|nr:3-isopropylmalate dehydratase small subunit [Acidobacteriota bacterium]
MSEDSVVERVAGRVVVLRGADVDTDRIMPARFLKAVTFEGLEQHLFADDRAANRARGDVHPLDEAAAGGAKILLVNSNFGCGSSREHAPQALFRWGFRAIVAESFAEIFAGNSLTIGLVCVTVPADVMATLMQDAGVKVLTIDLRAQTLAVPGVALWPITLPEASRMAWLSGEWDATALLLADYDEVAKVDARLPYLRTTSRNA